MSSDNVTVPLGIPDVRVLKTEMNAGGELIVTVGREYQAGDKLPSLWALDQQTTRTRGLGGSTAFTSIWAGNLSALPSEAL